ncbi:unnamed protein product, partial [Rotaria sp. Silwood1]
MSVGGAGAYPETSDAMAARLVSERGVYITFSQGNDGAQGLQTSGSPAISSGAMAIAVRCDKAAVAGAIGCLIYNVGAISGSASIPSGSISLADGQRITAITTENPSAVFTFTNLLEFGPVPTAGTPSRFSSLGLTGDLLFKPQISGIGGYVYSTISSFATKAQKLPTAYASYSGTSMACPYVAGTLALFLAKIGNPAPETVDNSLESENRRPSFSEIVNLFQSNAKPVKIYNTSMFAPTIQQGAGLVNAFQALTATMIISPSELALNDTVRQEAFYKIKISNIGKKAAVYKDVFIWPTTFKLEPGQSHMVTIRFEPPRKADAALLPIFSGFIDVSNNVDNKVAHVPYAGMIGNYKNAPILVRNSPSGIVSGLLGANGGFISNGQHMNLTASGAFPIILVTAWASRVVFVDVISGQNDVLPGFNP